MRLEERARAGWPPLAWVARCASDAVELEYGPGVAAGGGWAFEGAWAGGFVAGSFDEAAVVCGSGVRLRGRQAFFVAPTSTVDRLCSVETEGGVAVSNSLLALSASVGAEVTDPKYPARVRSVVRGLEVRAEGVESSAGLIRFTYFHNLVWDGSALTPRPKPPIEADPSGFAGYRAFLADSFAALAQNAADPSRGEPLRFLGTVSSGYDANAATALAAEAGCRQALAFPTTGSGHPDDGSLVGTALGLEITSLERDGWRAEKGAFAGVEAPALAAGVGSGLLGFHAARRLLGGSLLVTGFYGDSIWNPDWESLGSDLVRKDASGLGFCEYRLHAGFANCAPAFWAAREVADVVRISRSEEMEPWRLGGAYDRPIPRRILEEAGVPRAAFGQAKRGVPKAQPHRDARFLTPDAQADYFDWLRGRRKDFGLRRPVSRHRDRVQFGWYDLSLRIHVAAGRLPAVRSSKWWRRRRKQLRGRRRRPAPLRAYTVRWALDRGRDPYRRPPERDYAGGSRSGARGTIS